MFLLYIQNSALIETKQETKTSVFLPFSPQSVSIKLVYLPIFWDKISLCVSGLEPKASGFSFFLSPEMTSVYQHAKPHYPTQKLHSCEAAPIFLSPGFWQLSLCLISLCFCGFTCSVFFLHTDPWYVTQYVTFRVCGFFQHCVLRFTHSSALTNPLSVPWLQLHHTFVRWFANRHWPVSLVGQAAVNTSGRVPSVCFPFISVSA